MGTTRKSQEQSRSGHNTDYFTSVTSVNVYAATGFTSIDFSVDFSLCSPDKENDVC
jgi:hypothetical protein